MTPTRAATPPRLAFVALLAALLSVFLPVPRADAAATAAIQEVTGFGTNPGALKMYRYVPDGLPTGRPVVVALHGCTQNASGYGTGSGWTELADRWGFSVVLPQQQSGNNASSCFNWFQAGDIERGQGEAASVAQMVDRQLADASGDPAKVYLLILASAPAFTPGVKAISGLL
ncbi:alpha/beta hydrolase family esterase [Streptomyces sp. NPDC001939]